MSKLAQRIEEFKIPLPASHPVGDICMVYRIPGAEKVGVLYVPDEHREVAERGVLLSAGLKALDILSNHGVEIGDIVEFARFSGRERYDERQSEQGKPRKGVLRMRVEDIQASEDLAERLKGELTIIQETDESSEAYGQHFFERKGSK